MDKDYLSRIKTFARNNIFLIVLFFSTLLFALLQHYWFLSWDFSAYVLNARYLFFGGDYFEVYRAPLTPVLLGIFLFFGKTGEYLYISFVFLLFFLSSIYLSDTLYKKYWGKFGYSKEKIRVVFTFFTLNPFLLYNSTLSGTELLALSLFELFLAQMIRQSWSGHYLGLAALSRYNLLIFGFFMLFGKNIKRILINLLLVLAVTLPWLIYNKLRFGNLFSSIVDSYFLNIFSRSGQVQQFELGAVFISVNIFLPFLIFGLFLLFSNLNKKFVRKINIERENYWYGLIFIIIFLIIIYDYGTTPHKVTRYLFNLALPTAFFSTTALLHYSSRLKLNKKKVIAGIFIAFLFIFFFTLRAAYSERGYDEPYKDAAKTIKEIGISSCTVSSPNWVPVNYYTSNSPRYLYNLNSTLKSKRYALIFSCCSIVEEGITYEDMKDSALVRTKEYIILVGNDTNPTNCEQNEGWSEPHVKDSCSILREKFGKSSEKLCRIINFE